MSFLVKLFAIPSVLFVLFVCVAESQRNKVAASDATTVPQPVPQPIQTPKPEPTAREIQRNKEHDALSNGMMIMAEDRLIKWIMSAAYAGGRMLKPGDAGYVTPGVPRGLGSPAEISPRANYYFWDHSENFQGKLKYERIEDYGGMPAWKVQWLDKRYGYAYCEIYYDTTKKELDFRFRKVIEYGLDRINKF